MLLFDPCRRVYKSYMSPSLLQRSYSSSDPSKQTRTKSIHSRLNINRTPHPTVSIYMTISTHYQKQSKAQHSSQTSIPQTSITTNPTPKTDTRFPPAPLSLVSLALAPVLVPVLEALELRLAVAVAFNCPPQNTSLFPPFSLIQSSSLPMLCPCARQYMSHPSLYFVTAAGVQHLSIMEE